MKSTSPKIRVAHIITRLELGGAQQNTLYCCGHHDPKKYKVVLIAGVGGILDEQARQISSRISLYLLPELKHPIRPWWDLWALIKISWILKAEKVDIVHTHSSKAGILGRWAARLAGVPVVVHTIHGWGFHPKQFFISRWIYQSLERWVAPITDALIGVAQENVREGLAASIGRPEQYSVIHSGIIPSEFRISSSRASLLRRKWDIGKRPTVLVLSNFKKQKSPMDVVSVIEILKKNVPDVLLLWAGDGSGRIEVEQESQSRGLKDNFKFLGWRNDVADLLGVSDILLLTSIFEGLPRVVLQSFAAGRPVVATRVSGTPEAVTDGISGFLHEPHDTTLMANSLRILLEDPKRARQMGKAGTRILKGSFLMPEMLRQIEALYRRLWKK